MKKKELEKELNELKELVRKLFHINSEDKVEYPFDCMKMPERYAKELKKYL